MALRSSTMSMSFSDQTVEPQPEQYHLPRKLAIVLLLVIASSLWLYILYREKRLSYPTPVQEIAAGVIVAIVASLGAQLVLSKRDGFFDLWWRWQLMWPAFICWVLFRMANMGSANLDGCQNRSTMTV